MASDEEVRTLAVKIALDASSFTQQAQVFKRQVSALDTGFKASVAGIKDWGKHADNLKSHVNILGREIDVQKQVVSSYQSQISKTSSALEVHSKQLVRNKQRVSELRAAYQQSESTLGENADETKKLKAQLSDAESELSKSESQVKNNQKAVDGYTVQLNNATGKLNEMEAELKNANSALFDHTNKLALAGTALQKAGDKITSAGSKISGVGTALTAGVTAPIVGIGVAAEKTGMDFEAQMSRVQAISGATADELKDLTQTAMDLGAKTSYSDQEVAEGMENLASAGFTVNEIMDAMPGMLNLAASSGEDLANSADIAASTLRGFGLAADQAGHVADVLAKNAANTNAAVADTGLAMKYIAPVAKNAGWSLESVTAAIGEMADAGIKGEQAGTTLRGALTRLMKPTKQMRAAMEDIGFSAYDTSGHMKSLSQIISDLQKDTAGLTNEQRDQRIATIMGTESLSGMQVLLKDGSGALDSLTDSLEESNGAAQDMADTMLDNAKGSLGEMKGSVENAGIALSKSLSPYVKDASDKITELANKFAKLPQSTQQTIIKFAALAAIIGPLVVGVGKITQGVGTLTGTVGKGVSGIANFVKGVRGITPAAGEAVPAMAKLGALVAANPWLAVAAALAAVVAGLGAAVVAYMNAATPLSKLTDEIRDQNKAWQELKKTSDEQAKSNLAELNNTKQLWNQLQKLVDANGKVIGSKKEAKELVDLINSTTGQKELTLVGDQITGWNNAKKAIDKYIAARKSQILIDAYADQYKSAIKNYQNDYIKLSELQRTIIDNENKIALLQLNPTIQNMIKIEKLKKDVNAAKGQYTSYANTVHQETNLINRYNDAVAAQATGDYGKVAQVLQSSTLQYTKVTGANAEQLKNQVLDVQNALNNMKELHRKGQAGITNEEISAMQDRLKEAEKEYDKSVSQAGAAGRLITQTYGNSISQYAPQIHNAGESIGRDLLAGLRSPDTGSAGSNRAREYIRGINSNRASITQAGKSAGNAAKNGMASVDTSSAGRKAGNGFLNALERALNGGRSIAAKIASWFHINVSVGHNASGTENWRGGLTYINEKGGELVNLPNGTQIVPHDISMQIAKAVGQAVGNQPKYAPTVTVNIGSATKDDAYHIANVVSNVLARQINARR